MRTSPSSDTRRDLRSVLRDLGPEHRLAAIAACALAASIFLPWWRDPGFGGISYVGFRRLTFIELTLLVVAIAVLVLIARRVEGRVFHLPLSDGTLIAAAGAWATFLVVFRMIDSPTRTVEGHTIDYGMRWGVWFALAAALTLAVSGVRIRRHLHRGEPEAVAADADATPTLPLEH